MVCLSFVCEHLSYPFFFDIKYICKYKYRYIYIHTSFCSHEHLKESTYCKEVNQPHNLFFLNEFTLDVCVDFESQIS